MRCVALRYLVDGIFWGGGPETFCVQKERGTVRVYVLVWRPGVDVQKRILVFFSEHLVKTAVLLQPATLHGLCLIHAVGQVFVWTLICGVCVSDG